MAYRQKITKNDVRTIALKDLPQKMPVMEKGMTEERSDTSVYVHHPGADMRRIAFAAVPLIILLLIASYLDVTRQWVVPFAERLMHFAS